VYKKVDQDYQEQIAKEKELLYGKHKEELDQMRGEVIRETEIRMQKVWKMRLLTFSRFLAAVARRRQEEDLSEEGKAFEAVLAYVYSGDPNAVGAAEKVIDGVEELVPGLEGATLSVTCKCDSSYFIVDLAKCLQMRASRVSPCKRRLKTWTIHSQMNLPHRLLHTLNPPSPMPLLPKSIQLRFRTV